jgi:lipid-A-disaccharide synthase-like uncharacterized protein
MRWGCLILLLFCLTSGLRAAPPLEELGRPVDPSLIEGTPVRFKLELAGAKDNVKLARLRDGSEVFIIQRLGAGKDRMLSPEEFAKFYYDQRRSRGWISTIFNITSPAGLAWVALGLGGQLLFTGRMLVQWLTSEKERRSVIPVSFWWMSLTGATMLLVYFIWRRDIVGILGQATGWVIYVRNLVLIRRARG